eukprot:651897-Alexandrium_andersonii.AAC.1
MLNTCPQCEKSLPVGTTECEACSLSMEHQANILRRLRPGQTRRWFGTSPPCDSSTCEAAPSPAP